MEGQRQQQVALQFGVNVSTIERLHRRLRNTGRVGDRPRRGRPRVTTPRQDRAIRLAHLRNRHVTATKTALTTIDNHNRHTHPKTVRNRLREFGCELVDLTLVFLSLVHVARVVWLGWRHMVQDNFQLGNGDGSFSQMSRGSLFFVERSTLCILTSWGTLAFLRGICLGWLAYGLARDVSRVKVAVDCDSR